MTKEELLIPRVKVMFDYPQPFLMKNKRKGDILILHEYQYGYYNKDGAWLSKTEIDKYPDLFKPLEWWEDRAWEDMPKYVKMKYTGRIHQIANFQNSILFIAKTGGLYSIRLAYPATKEEYEQYQLNLKK